MDYVHVCSHCSEEIQRKSVGDESWNYCESYELVEGETEEISEEEFERRNG